MKPIIGIVAKYLEDSISNDVLTDTIIRDEVRNAVLENGGLPIGILSTQVNIDFNHNIDSDFENEISKQQKQDFISQIKLCDGVILQGGRSSMKYESWIAKYLYENDIPTLGICGGQNAMVRGLGGTTKFVENQEKHHQHFVDEAHYIHINKKSKFYKIVKCETMPVNSRHFKTVDKLPKEFIVSAVCDDGYSDVIESPNKKFFMAVRFHPESLYTKYKEHNNIFKAFINVCKSDKK